LAGADATRAATGFHDESVLTAHLGTLRTFQEFWRFLRQRKKYWLWPVFIMIAALGFLIVITQGSAIAPFIYTLF